MPPPPTIVRDIKNSPANRTAVAYGPVNIDRYFNYPPGDLIINHPRYTFTFPGDFVRSPAVTRCHLPVRDGTAGCG